MRPPIMAGHSYGGVHVIRRLGLFNKSLMWEVRCNFCGKEYRLASNDVVKNAYGCSECYNSKRPTGPLSPSWKGGSFVSRRFVSNAKRNASRRNISFEIDLDFLDRLWEKQEGKCAYSDVLLVMGDTASLDRIDSSRGYTEDNVQFVHKVINVMKWNLPEDVFLAQLNLIWRKMTNA